MTAPALLLAGAPAVVLDALQALAALAAAAALPLLLVLALRGWVRRAPTPVQSPRSATGLAGADLRAPLPGSAPSPLPASGASGRPDRPGRS